MGLVRSITFLSHTQVSDGSGVVLWLWHRLGSQPPDIALPCMLELLTVLPEVRLHTLSRPRSVIGISYIDGHNKRRVGSTATADASRVSCDSRTTQDVLKAPDSADVLNVGPSDRWYHSPVDLQVIVPRGTGSYGVPASCPP